MKLSGLKFPLVIGLLITSTFSCASGLTLGATRLIYPAGVKEASVALTNGTTQTPYLVQSWVSDINQKIESIPFITTPPVFKLLPNKSIPVRVVYLSEKGHALPQDRESIYLLNVRAIPAVEKTPKPTRMTISTQNIIKLIYRPKGLTAKGAGDAWEKQQVTPGNGVISVTNPTPYAVTLTRMTINGKSVERPGIVMPFSSLKIKTDEKKVRSVTLSLINDYGGISPEKTSTFNE